MKKSGNRKWYQRLLCLWLISILLLSGCGRDDNSAEISTSDDTETIEKDSSVEEENMISNDSGDFTLETRVTEVMENPAFGDYGRLIFPADVNISNSLELKDIGTILTWYNNVNPEKTVEIVNYLKNQAEAEIQNKEYPDISVDVENLSQYQTIFVGYPIWFDEAPAMIATFLAENDFSEKTIVPFCTSAGDSIDNSLHIFKELSPNAEILEGLTVENETDIEPWLEKLGFLS